MKALQLGAKPLQSRMPRMPPMLGARPKPRTPRPRTPRPRGGGLEAAAADSGNTFGQRKSINPHGLGLQQESNHDLGTQHIARVIFLGTVHWGNCHTTGPPSLALLASPFGRSYSSHRTRSQTKSWAHGLPLQVTAATTPRFFAAISLPCVESRAAVVWYP